MLAHIVDGTQEDPTEAYRTVRGELEAYGAELATRPEIVALNKTDALDAAEQAARATALEAACGAPVHLISGVTGDGVRALMFALWEVVKARRAQEAADAKAAEAGDAPEEPAGWRP